MHIHSDNPEFEVWLVMKIVMKIEKGLMWTQQYIAISPNKQIR